MKTFKTTLFTLVLVLFSSSLALATKSPKTFADFYKKYKQENQSFSMSLPTFFFQWALEDDEKELVKGIQNVKLLILEDAGALQQKLTADIKDYFPENTYHDLMIVQDGGDRITLKFREKDKKNNEFILLIRDNNSLVSLCLTGKLTTKEAVKIVQSMNMDQIKDTLD